MKQPELLEKIKEKLNELGYDNSNMVTMETPFGDDAKLPGPDPGLTRIVQGLGMDSLDRLEVAIHVEGIVCKGSEEEDLQKMKTVGDMVKFFADSE